MKKLHILIFSSILYFFTACGDDSVDSIDTSRGFDMWEYMTSQLNYEVEYEIFENNVAAGNYFETHHYSPNSYERKSDSGITRIFLSAHTIEMQEPTGTIDIVRFVYLGDAGVFRSPDIKLCTVEGFFNRYNTQGRVFYNTLKIACTNHNGIYQEFYYGYNEGLVSFYLRDGTVEKEYVKVGERRIF